MVRKLEDLEKPSTVGEIKRWAESFMNYIFSQSQENLVKNKSIDTGFLLRSGKPPFWDGNVLRLEYDCPYALFVEYGTQPHPVSAKHLIGWVKRKLRVKDKKSLSVAWAIANKIKKKGTDPKPFLRPAVNQALKKYGVKLKPLKI